MNVESKPKDFGCSLTLVNLVSNGHARDRHLRPSVRPLTLGQLIVGDGDDHDLPLMMHLPSYAERVVDADEEVHSFVSILFSTQLMTSNKGLHSVYRAAIDRRRRHCVPWAWLRRQSQGAR